MVSEAVYTSGMKWFFLLLGVSALVLSWAIVQIGQGVMFTHGGFTEWNDEFYLAYRNCCLMTDLNSALPFALTGLLSICVAVWQFRKR